MAKNTTKNLWHSRFGTWSWDQDKVSGSHVLAKRSAVQDGRSLGRLLPIWQPEQQLLWPPAIYSKKINAKIILGIKVFFAKLLTRGATQNKEQKPEKIIWTEEKLKQWTSIGKIADQRRLTWTNVNMSWNQAIRQLNWRPFRRQTSPHSPQVTTARWWGWVVTWTLHEHWGINFYTTNTKIFVGPPFASELLSS